MTTTRVEKLLTILFLLCFALVVTRNVVERVQAYTHPLWMLLLSAVYFFTRESFFSSQLLSITVSLLAVFVLVTRIANSSTAALLGGSDSHVVESLCGLFHVGAGEPPHTFDSCSISSCLYQI